MSYLSIDAAVIKIVIFWLIYAGVGDCFSDTPAYPKIIEQSGILCQYMLYVSVFSSHLNILFVFSNISYKGLNQITASAPKITPPCYVSIVETSAL